METKTFCDMLDKLKISLHRDADGYYMRDNAIADGGKLEGERYDDVLIIATRLDPYVKDYYITDLKKDIADTFGLVVPDVGKQGRSMGEDAITLAKYIKDHEALKTAYSHEYDVLKLWSSPADLDKVDLDAAVQYFDKYKARNTYFHLDKDLKNCSDSLLFDSDEGIAEAYFTDGHGNDVEMELIVTGEVNVSYKGVVYTAPSDFPADLVDIIRAGDVWYHDDVFVNSNNWFELVCTVKNAKGEEIAYDGDVWESDLTKMTDDDLKSKLRDYADYLLDRYKNQLTHSASQTKEFEDMQYRLNCLGIDIVAINETIKTMEGIVKCVGYSDVEFNDNAIEVIDLALNEQGAKGRANGSVLNDLTDIIITAYYNETAYVLNQYAEDNKLNVHFESLNKKTYGDYELIDENGEEITNSDDLKKLLGSVETAQSKDKTADVER